MHNFLEQTAQDLFLKMVFHQKVTMIFLSREKTLQYVAPIYFVLKIKSSRLIFISSLGETVTPDGIKAPSEYPDINLFKNWWSTKNQNTPTYGNNTD